MENKNYKISVIIPVYNTEEYLEESIKSIINQSIGFNNIELILINDGSTDNSEKICLDYKNKYSNITYISQKNQGVSATRNNGAEKAKSDYILFLDSDDLLYKKSLESLYNFIIKHKEIDFVGSRCKYFDRKNNWHYSEERFKNGDVIVDINNNKFITYNQYFSTGVLFRKKAFLKVKYDINIKYNEDIQLINNLLYNNPKFGLCSNSVLYYRKRDIKTSAVDNQKKDKTYYKDVIDMYIDFINKLIKKYKEIPYYFQYSIYFIMRDRLNGNVSLLNKKELKEYKDKFYKIISNISPEIIALNTSINTEHLMYLLKLNNNELNVKIKQDKTKLNNLIVNKDDIRYCAINSIEIKNNKIEIILAINTEIVDPNNININNYNGKITEFNYRKNPRDIEGKVIKYNNKYKYILPINKNNYNIKYNDINLPIYVQNIKKKHQVDKDTKIIYRKKYIIKYNNNEFKIIKNNIINRMIYSIKRNQYESYIKRNNF